MCQCNLYWQSWQYDRYLCLAVPAPVSWQCQCTLVSWWPVLVTIYLHSYSLLAVRTFLFPLKQQFLFPQTNNVTSSETLRWFIIIIWGVWSETVKFCALEIFISWTLSKVFQWTKYWSIFPVIHHLLSIHRPHYSCWEVYFVNEGSTRKCFKLSLAKLLAIHIREHYYHSETISYAFPHFIGEEYWYYFQILQK